MMTRRRFLGLTALAFPAAVGVNAAVVEPTSLQIRYLALRENGPTRLVHFSDLHYRGDTEYAERVVRLINGLKADFVCFTGDLVEDKDFAPEALAMIRAIDAPVYGSPGNHDYWSGADFKLYHAAFAATGGEWLVDRSVVLEKHGLEIVGIALTATRALRAPRAGKRLLLLHYPVMADRLQGATFDLILAGHSHGGQVRLPFIGAPLLPRGVGAYDLGNFETPGGPLSVTAGIGTYRLPIRFNCSPEVTLVTL